MMRVIRFDKRLLSRKSDVASRSGRRAVNRLRLPYRDYRDYVRRNRKQGGFFFPVEKFDQKLGGHSVDIYEVQVDKLARGGRRHCIAYVFRGGDVDFAVEFEFLEHRFRKLKPLELTVHEIRFSAAGADALGDVKAVQLGMQLGADKATAETQGASHAIRLDALGESPEPIVPAWSVRTEKERSRRWSLCAHLGDAHAEVSIQRPDIRPLYHNTATGIVQPPVAPLNQRR